MLYVYAITADHTAEAERFLPPEGILPGISVAQLPAAALGEPALADCSLAVLASAVPENVFGQEPLRAHLADATWSRACVLAHQHVVSALLPVATVLPLKFCTLFASPVSVAKALLARREELEASVARLRGAREWGVKLFLDPAPRTARTAEPIGAGAGLAFFRRKKEEQEARAAAEAALDHCVSLSHQRLAAGARAAVANPLQPPELHGQAATMALNGAYLVATEDDAAWRASLAELERAHAHLGARYVLTGPWAPYHFTGGGLV
ncbi:GvpL/GvpF family gas vesicle protein [Ancylobacter sp. IITR112]|uniref:GvpL/GvpF family gas vesicle protein n=1 Tax=Ancylobacter sp. IITR112 TaxID=3138073 RepID=UPI00352A7364